jgi:competence protein ComEC
VNKNIKIFLYTISSLLLVILLVLNISKDKSIKNLEVTFLNVGQGDSTFIKTPNNKNILIDSGPKNVVLNKLRQIMNRKDKTLDMLVVTNPDADHISGFNYILDDYNVLSVLLPGTSSTTETYKELIKNIKSKNIPIIYAYRGMKIYLDKENEVLMSVLFPDQIVRLWERNNGSLVFKLNHKNNSVLFMGDATVETEKIILSTQINDNLKSDILKVGHHGSNTSTSEEFLDIVSPKFAILSYGEGNKYGHPHEEVVSHLEDRDINILETSLLDNIKFLSNGESWILESLYK